MIFQNEKHIQTIIENSVKEVFGLTFISSEFSCDSFRFDSVCYDEETNAFVIIEYKNSKSSSLIDQGFSYLSIMLNNKAEFVLEYNGKNSSSLKKNDFDWSQSRVIFISTSFSQYQKTAVNFSDIPFELWEIKKFSGETIGLNQIITNSKFKFKIDFKLKVKLH